MSDSSASQNKAIIRRLYDEFVNNGDVDVFYEIVSEGVREHEELPGFTPDREGILQFFDTMRQAFPDLRFVVEDLISEGEKVVARIRMQGTHRGEFMGAAPTRNQVDVPLIDVFRLSDGKVEEHWGVMDSLTMMQQIGLAPA